MWCGTSTVEVENPDSNSTEAASDQTDPEGLYTHYTDPNIYTPSRFLSLSMSLSMLSRTSN